ncbi:MAG: von Willebrand factor type like domain [Rhodocyclaceae bacterium]|nr:von Willebrand factor type like domain [Rhodocyclaceae bacterium]
MSQVGNSRCGRALLAFFVCVLAMLLVPAGSAQAKSPAKEERTLSPYFFVKSDDAKVDQLPLKSTRTEVKIAGVIADVTVTQTYANNGQTPIEATYVFPASTRAAVHGMKMTIGDRVVVARINKREEARRQYEQARQQGKSASLLEQQRPNVFQMNLANIMPGDEIKVELRYTELIVPEDGVYEFVYPTVVGPRYSNLPESKATPADQWVKNPTLHQGEAPTSTFDIRVDIAGGMPIKDVACPTHQTDIAFDGPQAASIRLDPREAQGGNRDFVVRYRLDGNRIQSGLLLQQGEDENYFLLTLQPPRRVSPAQIPGRDYIFIVDVSGSMHGFPLETSKELVHNLLDRLRPSDRFNVLLFAGGSDVMAEESLPATPENIRKAIDLIRQQQGGGGTELLPALKRALSLKATEGYSRSVVIATDGYVDVEEEVFDLIRNNLDRANMFTFGIGTSVNRHLLEGMARVGRGEPFVIANAGEAAAEAERFRKLIESPVLTGIKVRFDGFDAYDVEPAKIPDLLAERPLVLFGKWRGSPTGRIAVSGTSGDGPFSEVVDVEKHEPSPLASALRYLWARNRIMLLSDYNKLRPNDRRVAEVTELGLKHNLLTAYTSFVAIDSEVRNKEGNGATVAQPLPLPEGVSDLAVPSGKMLAAPMPLAPRVTLSAQKLTLAAEVLFDFNQATLRPEGKAELDKIAAKSQNMHLEVILAVGHMDRLEGEGANRKLAEQRAAAVKDYLVSKGVPASKIYIEGKGAKQPVTPPDQCKGAKSARVIACLQRDRRVDIEAVGTR